MSSRVWESTVIDAPIEKVWELVRPLNFAYSPQVVSCKVDAGHQPNEVGVVHVVEYKDGTVQKIKVLEISDVTRTVAWDLIHSAPAHHVEAASYQVRLRRVSQGNATFVEWTVDFSSDVSAAVLADAAFKAKDHFNWLYQAVKHRLIQEAKTASFQVGRGRVTVPQLRRQLSEKSNQLQSLFASLDKNHNGVLDQEEFTFAVNKLYGENLPDDAVRLLLTLADLNGDRVVSYEEFLKFIAAEGLESKAQFEAAKASRKIKIFYFNSKGRGEFLRLLCAEAGQPFEDVRFEKKDWEGKFKAQAPMGQAPWIEVDGKALAQSAACERYLATIFQLYGSTSTDRARIDMLMEAINTDIAPALYTAFFAPAEEKKAKLEHFYTNVWPKWGAYLERELKSNHGGSGYFVGHSLSVIDTHFFHFVSAVTSAKPDALNPFPLLAALTKRVEARPNIAKWLKARPVTNM